MTQRALQVLEQDSGFLFGRLDGLGVIIWYETPTAERVRKIAARLQELGSDRGFAILTVVTPACTPVGADVRTVFDQALQDNRDSLLGIATVIQVEGVLGGLTRAIARTMSVISRVPYPNNIYATVGDAAKWLPQVLGQRQETSLKSDYIAEVVNAKLR